MVKLLNTLNTSLLDFCSTSPVKVYLVPSVTISLVPPRRHSTIGGGIPTAMQPIEIPVGMVKFIVKDRCGNTTWGLTKFHTKYSIAACASYHVLLQFVQLTLGCLISWMLCKCNHRHLSTAPFEFSMSRLIKENIQKATYQCLVHLDSSRRLEWEFLLQNNEEITCCPQQQTRSVVVRG